MLFKNLNKKIFMRENLELRSDFNHYCWIAYRAFRVRLHCTLVCGLEISKVSAYCSLSDCKKCAIV